MKLLCGRGFWTIFWLVLKTIFTDSFWIMSLQNFTFEYSAFFSVMWNYCVVEESERFSARSEKPFHGLVLNHYVTRLKKSVLEHTVISYYYQCTNISQKSQQIELSAIKNASGNAEATFLLHLRRTMTFSSLFCALI